MKPTTNSIAVKKLTYVALLTALVFVLQFFFSGFRLGTFTVSVVLVPIVLGAALAGPLAGLWLGLVFGVAVLAIGAALASGDAALFYGFNAFGTIVTVLLKGALAGLVTGLVYRALARVNRTLSSAVSAVVCPIVNTGVFLIGCRVFFWDLLGQWAQEGYGNNVVAYAFLGLVGANFLFEVGFNLILAPVILRILDMQSKKAE